MALKKNILKRSLSISYLTVFLLAVIFLISAGCSRYSQEDIRTVPDKSSTGYSAKVYFIDQHFWSIGDKFTITDERGIPRFFVKKRLLTLGDRLNFTDTRGRLIFSIKQKFLSFQKLYRIYSNGKLVARVVKKLRPFNDKFVIDLPGGGRYLVKGNFTNHKYSFFRHGIKVVQISKNWGTVTDNYMVKIGPREDDLLVLASAVIIDMASHRDKESY